MLGLKIVVTVLTLFTLCVGVVSCSTRKTVDLTDAAVFTALTLGLVWMW